MKSFRHCTSRRWRPILLATAVVTALVFYITTSDWNELHRHTVELRVALWRAAGQMPAPATSPAPWISSEPTYRGEDIVLILKTGWQTQTQLEAALAALPPDRTPANTLIISDHSAETVGRNMTWSVVDVIAPLEKDAALNGSERIAIYQTLQRHIRDGELVAAHDVKGWLIDQLKVVPGFELAYRLRPTYLWYVMVDDDTFVHLPSLLDALRGLNASKPHYLGGALDGAIRVAYGGGGVVLSQGAMRLLHLAAPGAMRDVAWHNREGDIALGWALAQAAGVHLSEDRSAAFAGGTLAETPIAAARACVPAATLHHVRPSEFTHLHRLLATMKGSVNWLELWTMLVGDGYERKQAWTFNYRETKNGQVDSSARDHAACKRACDGKGCMTWTWHEEASRCFLSTIMNVGRVDTAAVSGLDSAKVLDLKAICQS